MLQTTEQLKETIENLRVQLKNELTTTTNYDFDVVPKYQPKHPISKSMVFDTETEAKLVHQLSIIIEQNNMSSNDLRYMIPIIFRILKIDSDWSK